MSLVSERDENIGRYQAVYSGGNVMLSVPEFPRLTVRSHPPFPSLVRVRHGGLRTNPYPSLYSRRQLKRASFKRRSDTKLSRQETLILEDTLKRLKVQPEDVQLKRGEVKELTEGIFVKKSDDGQIKLYITE
jgi:hypothetical protein